MITPLKRGQPKEDRTRPIYKAFGKFGFTLRITATQLSKSTINANKVVRRTLSNSGLIDYSTINPGNNEILPCTIRVGGKVIQTKASFLIPRRRSEKSPEPRLWPYKLNSVVSPNSLLWFVGHKDHLEVRDSEP